MAAWFYTPCGLSSAVQVIRIALRSAVRLQDGQPVAYITSQGEELLKGTVRIDPDPSGTSGILCACCDAVISCSQFEAHAGRGSRRAPYDNIFTADGLSLRKVRLLPKAFLVGNL
jgi:hypothetical protein